MTKRKLNLLLHRYLCSFLFFGANTGVDNKFYAFDAMKGSPIGIWETGYWITSSPTVSAANDMVYIGSEGKGFYDE